MMSAWAPETIWRASCCEPAKLKKKVTPGFFWRNASAMSLKGPVRDAAAKTLTSLAVFGCEGVTPGDRRRAQDQRRRLNRRGAAMGIGFFNRAVGCLQQDTKNRRLAPCRTVCP